MPQARQDSAFVLVDGALDSLATFIGPSGNFQAGPTQGDMDIYVIDQCGAEGTFNVSVVVYDTEIPNVFSPNGDSMNDFFRIPGIEGFPNSKLEIYNRWAMSSTKATTTEAAGMDESTTNPLPTEPTITSCAAPMVVLPRGLDDYTAAALMPKRFKKSPEAGLFLLWAMRD